MFLNDQDMLSAQLVVRRLDLALGGDQRELRTLIDQLTPIIQGRIARTLLRAVPAMRSSSQIREQVRDLTQDVLLRLFEHEGRLLRHWDRKRGLSFDNYIGLLAERAVISVLRSKRQNPWTEKSAGDDLWQGVAEPVCEAEDAMLSRDLLITLIGRLRAQLSQDGLAMFYALFVDEKSVEAICQEFDTTADAVYAWRSRLRRLARQAIDEMSSLSDPVHSPRTVSYASGA